MSAPFGKNTIRITDLKKGITSANELNEGEHGTIFTRASLGLLKTGEVLEFS
jgi:hypothetical protein